MKSQIIQIRQTFKEIILNTDYIDKTNTRRDYTKHRLYREDKHLKRLY